MGEAWLSRGAARGRVELGKPVFRRAHYSRKSMEDPKWHDVRVLDNADTGVTGVPSWVGAWVGFVGVGGWPYSSVA